MRAYPLYALSLAAAMAAGVFVLTQANAEGYGVPRGQAETPPMTRQSRRRYPSPVSISIGFGRRLAKLAKEEPKKIWV